MSEIGGGGMKESGGGGGASASGGGGGDGGLANGSTRGAGGWLLSKPFITTSIMMSDKFQACCFAPVASSTGSRSPSRFKRLSQLGSLQNTRDTTADYLNFLAYY